MLVMELEVDTYYHEEENWEVVKTLILFEKIDTGRYMYWSWRRFLEILETIATFGAEEDRIDWKIYAFGSGELQQLITNTLFSN